MTGTMVKIAPHGLPYVFTDGRTLYTKNLVPGRFVYGENLVEQKGVEYRAWNPKRSKLASFILKGCRTFPFKPDGTVLYLGAATGTTASHLSDIVTDGMIHCIEISPPPFRKLVSLCETRKNMTPILADAGKPEAYENLLDPADILYQDIAQRDQVEIFLKNLPLLKAGGAAYLMVKARSIDVSKNPSEVFDSVKLELKDKSLDILEAANLAPYEKDHMAIVCQNRS